MYRWNSDTKPLSSLNIYKFAKSSLKTMQHFAKS